MTQKQFGTGMVSCVEALGDTASPWNYPRHRRVEFRINPPTMLPTYRVNLQSSCPFGWQSVPEKVYHSVIYLLDRQKTAERTR